jgi:hypothetical protein
MEEPRSRAPAHDNFQNLQAVFNALDAFERRYNEVAKPFDWRFIPADLDNLNARPDQQPGLQLAA